MPAVADIRGGGRRETQAPPNNFYWSFSFEKWKYKKVFNLRSGTITYYLVQFI